MRLQRAVCLFALILVVAAIGRRLMISLRQQQRQQRDQLLIQAVSQGDLSRVQSLVQQGANIHRILREWVPISLEEARQEAHLPPGKPTSARHFAVEAFLLDRVAKDRIDTYELRTAMDMAVDADRVDMVERLLEQSQPVEPWLRIPLVFVLQEAIYEGRIEIVKLLWDRGIHMPTLEGGDMRYACANPDGISIVRLLLKRGVDVNATTPGGVTALMDAALSGSTGTVHLLLEHGAKINLRDKQGETALILATYKGYTDTVKELISQGADLNIRSTYYGTALQTARKLKYQEIIRLLSQAGAKE